MTQAVTGIEREMAKVVQTDLDEDEYWLFRELLEKQKLSIREGLRLAVGRMVKEDARFDPKDPFLNRKPMGRSGLGDLSSKHDKYLYGTNRKRGSFSTRSHYSL